MSMNTERLGNETALYNVRALVVSTLYYTDIIYRPSVLSSSDL